MLASGKGGELVLNLFGVMGLVVGERIGIDAAVYELLVFSQFAGIEGHTMLAIERLFKYVA